MDEKTVRKRGNWRFIPRRISSLRRVAVPGRSVRRKTARGAGWARITA